MESTVEAQYLLALLQCPGLRPSKLRGTLLRYGSAQRLYDLEFDPADSEEHALADLIRVRRNQSILDQARRRLDVVTALKARVITILDDEYPLSLSQWSSSPLIIYVRGEFSRINDYAVAVVGTRNATSEGTRSATALAHQLAEKNVTVLSGLARGIDTAAHRGALSVKGGRTIAVVGTGLDIVYPAENRDLQEAILASSGAVVSQFPPQTIIQKMNFPQRNMLMSALSQGTVVVEAGQTSGAKLQAEYALKQHRWVFLTQRQVSIHPWASKLAESHKDSVVVVRDVRDVLDNIVDLSQLGQSFGSRPNSQISLLVDSW